MFPEERLPSFHAHCLNPNKAGAISQTSSSFVMFKGTIDLRLSFQLSWERCAVWTNVPFVFTWTLNETFMPRFKVAFYGVAFKCRGTFCGGCFLSHWIAPSPPPPPLVSWASAQSGHSPNAQEKKSDLCRLKYNEVQFQSWLSNKVHHRATLLKILTKYLIYTEKKPDMKGTEQIRHLSRTFEFCQKRKRIYIH